MTTLTINNDKTVSINGAKTFPVNLYSICYDAGGGNAECNLSDKTDFDINITGYPPSIIYNNIYNIPWTVRITLPDANIPDINTILSKPLCVSWLQPDEPNGIDPGKTVADVSANYTRIKSIDTTRPVILNHYKDSHIWYPYCDIYTWDNYGIRNNYWSPNGPVPCNFIRDDCIYAYDIKCKISAFKSIDLNAIPKPVWAVVQANGADMVSDGLLTPTSIEIRATVYDAICMDVKGISFWSYHIGYYTTEIGLYMNQPLFEYYKKLTRELHLLNDILVLPTQAYSVYGHIDNTTITITPNPIKTFSSSPALQSTPTNTFSYILKNDTTNNIKYLIIVNKDINPIQNVSIKVNGLLDTYYVTTLGTTEAGSRPNRQITINNGTFIDSFLSYETNIYQISDCQQPQCNFSIQQI